MANLSPDGKCFLRGMARDQDQKKAHKKFLLSQAEENTRNAGEKRAVADRRKKRADDRTTKLKKFEPILSLKELQEMTVDGDKAALIKEQLSWHRHIGKDVNIPSGFHAFRKAKAWVAMIQAVKRHLRGEADLKTEGMSTQQWYLIQGLEIL
jgi:hypothetical protein